MKKNGFAFFILFLGISIYFFAYFLWSLLVHKFVTLSILTLIITFIPSLILVIFSVPTLKTFSFNKVTRKIMIALLVIMVISPNIYFGAKMYSNYTKSIYSYEKWVNSPKERVHIVDDMLMENKLQGKTKKEIIDLLGMPTENEYFSKPNRIVYYLGLERNFISIEHEWLIIILDDEGKCVEYKIEVN